MILENYHSKPYDFKNLMNKEQFPQTNLAWTDYKIFNEIYSWCQQNMIEGKKTASGGIAGGPWNRGHSFYFTNNKKKSVELIVADVVYGCFKFVVNERKSDDNVIRGGKAVKTVFKLAKEFNVKDIFEAEAVESDEGEKIKSEIESPIVKVVSDIYKGHEFDHCYHIDANSSYFSRICEWKPELQPLGNYLYQNRKNNNGLYKHIMTNSIGCMQSDYCPNIFDSDSYYGHKKPYQLAKFAKVAINGTNRFIEDMYFKLLINGFEPLLINTDGIWYKDSKNGNRCYHDDNEGTNLGQWKNDHKDVKLYIKSAGSYQYIEDGQVKTVVRGTSNLDRIKPDRDTWLWREIEKVVIINFRFNEKVGIVADEEE